MIYFSRDELRILKRLTEVIECRNLLRLADELSVSHISAKRSVNRLEKIGILEVQRRKRGVPMQIRFRRQTS